MPFSSRHHFAVHSFAHVQQEPLEDFFRFQIMRGHLRGDPTLPIERVRSREVYRTTFTAEERRAIVTEQPDLRDRLCLRLLLDSGCVRARCKRASSSTSTTSAAD